MIAGRGDLDDLAEQLPFGAEGVGQRLDGDTRVLRDAVHRGRGIPIADEERALSSIRRRVLSSPLSPGGSCTLDRSHGVRGSTSESSSATPSRKVSLMPVMRISVILRCTRENVFDHLYDHRSELEWNPKCERMES